MSNITPPIDIQPEHWIIVRDILRKHVPHYPVWAFGSRAKWTANEHSDLNIVIVDDKPVNLSFLADLKDDLQDSTLPFKVDVVDYAELTPAFRKIVQTTKVVLQLSEQSLGGEVWSCVRLGDYCEKIGSGATPKGGKETYLPEGSYRLIRSQNIYNNGFKYEGLAFISYEQAKKLDSVIVNAGDVLLNITGDSVARVCSAPSDVLPARVNQHVAIIRPMQEAFDARFIRYYLATPQQQEMLLVMASSGATRNALTKRMIESLRIPKPSLNEQETISTILGSLDDRITLLRETNATLESIAQALFKSWFVDFDPVRAKMEGREPEGMDAETAALFPDGFEESDLGLVPRGWRVGKLEDLLVLQRGFDLPAADRVSGDYPIIAASGPAGRHNAAMAKAPGVVTGRSGVLGRVFLELEDYWPLNTTLWVKQFRAASPCYAYELLRLLDFASFNAGSAVPTLNRNHVHSLPYLIPERKCIDAYELISMVIQKRIWANLRQTQVLATLRDTLLPRLISGQLRLPEAETILEAVQV